MRRGGCPLSKSACPTSPPSSVTHRVAAPPVAVVTGASGWLGKNLVRALVDDARARALPDPHGRRGAAARAASARRSRSSSATCATRSPLDRLFDGVDGATVFHAAAVIHPASATREFFDVNVGGTETGARPGPARARDAGSCTSRRTRRSAPTPDPTDRFTEDSPYNPYMGYGRSKLEAEQLVQRSHDRGDVETVIVRAPWFYGPFQPDRQTQWFAAVRRGRFPLVGAGHAAALDGFTGNLVARAAARRGRDRGAGPRVLDRRRRAVRAARDPRARCAPRSRPRGCRSRAAQPELPARRRRGRRRARRRCCRAGAGTSRRCTCSASSRTRSPATSPGPAAELGYDPQVSLFDGMRASVRWCLERGQADLMAAHAAGHRRQRLLRQRARRAGARPRRPRSASSTSTRRASRAADVDFVQGDVRDRDGAARRVRRRRRGAAQRRAGAAGQGPRAVLVGERGRHRQRAARGARRRGRQGRAHVVERDLRHPGVEPGDRGHAAAARSRTTAGRSSQAELLCHDAVARRARRHDRPARARSSGTAGSGSWRSCSSSSPTARRCSCSGSGDNRYQFVHAERPRRRVPARRAAGPGPRSTTSARRRSARCARRCRRSSTTRAPGRGCGRCRSGRRGPRCRALGERRARAVRAVPLAALRRVALVRRHQGRAPSSAGSRGTRTRRW